MGTYHLNTPGGHFPQVDSAWQAAFVQRQWEAWGRAAAPEALEGRWKQDRERRRSQHSVLDFAEKLGGAAGLTLRHLPAPLEDWIASGSWARWMANLRRQVEATGEIRPSERRARKRLIKRLDRDVEPARVEIAYAHDNVSTTFYVRFRPVGTDVLVSWHPRTNRTTIRGGPGCHRPGS